MQVFLSHAAEDENWAEKIRSALNEAGFHVWDPTEKLSSGLNWHLEIGKALEHSDAMIVLLSPDSVKSKWVQAEIDFALGNPRFRDRLIPVLVRPTDDVPWILDRQPMIRTTKDVKKTVRSLKAALKK